MKYKPLVVKETLAKDFIRSVHHVWGSAESCSTTRDLLCDKWLSQLLTTKHMPVLPLWEAPQSSSYATGLFWRPNTWTEHSQHHNFLELSPGWPMKNMSCTHSTHQPRKRRILSDEEWATSLPRSLTRPVSTASLHLPLPVERLHENTRPPWDVSLTPWWNLWFQSAPTQCKNLSLGSFTCSLPNIIIW